MAHITPLLPPEIAQSRPVQVLERSIERGRLAHGLLLSGDSMEPLEQVAQALAKVLLGTERDPAKHPDYFSVRPAKRSRAINVEATRELIRSIHLSSNAGGNKVAVVYEADRMNKASANAFLKTLEEPPGGTTILMLTVRPHDLLDTIRSRTFSFRIPSRGDAIGGAAWAAWRKDYSGWLEHLVGGVKAARERTEVVMRAYGLMHRFVQLTEEIGAEAWARQKAELPEEADKDTIEAEKVGVQRGARQRMLTEVEEETRLFALRIAHKTQRFPAMPLAKAVGALEEVVGLLALNMPEASAIEHFFLQSLRIWTTR